MPVPACSPTAGAAPRAFQVSRRQIPRSLPPRRTHPTRHHRPTAWRVPGPSNAVRRRSTPSKSARADADDSNGFPVANAGDDADVYGLPSEREPTASSSSARPDADVDEYHSVDTIPECSEESLDDFVARVCGRLGRGADDARGIACKLRANWYEHPSDLASVLGNVEQLCAIGVPARFCQEAAVTLREDAERTRRVEAAAIGDGVDDAGAFAAPTAVGGWSGGDLPGPLERLPGPRTGRAVAATRGGIALSSVRVMARKRLPPYALRDDRLPASLASELAKLRRDVTARRVGGGKAPVRQTTANNYVDVAKCLMGWYVRVKLNGWDGVTLSGGSDAVAKAAEAAEAAAANPPEGLSLRDVIPSDSAESAELAIEYVQWLCEVRGISPTTEDFQLRSLVAIAKWLHGSALQGSVLGPGGYVPPPVVQELIRVQRFARQRADLAPSVADEASKWLDWPEYLRLVETLRQECAPLTHKGERRPQKDVAMALQRYLLFAILACVPDRQRTLRELELNRTLFCEEYDEAIDVSVSSSNENDGNDDSEEGGEVTWVRRRRWVVRHSPEDYKTGGAYGVRPSLVLDPRLYPALEVWLFGRKWDEGGGWGTGGTEATLRGFDASGGYPSSGLRAALLPEHARVFCRPNGEATLTAMKPTHFWSALKSRTLAALNIETKICRAHVSFAPARIFFALRHGTEWNPSELSRTFSRTALRLTGKKTNPHLIRDMIITHVRGEGLATDAELEALSLYMGHSVAMQKGTYDRRTQQQKVAPAIGLMSAINARAAVGSTNRRTGK